jgi:hypothetical protein
MIFSDLSSPAEASNETTNRCLGFAQAGNRNTTFRDHALEAGRRSLALQESTGKLAQFACNMRRRIDAAAAPGVPADAARRVCGTEVLHVALFVLARWAGEDLTFARQTSDEAWLVLLANTHGGKQLKAGNFSKVPDVLAGAE